MKLLRSRNRTNLGQIDSFDKQTEWINNGDWKAPDEWIDISHPPNNEIYMLATDGIVQFSIVCAGGTYSVEWGDGVTNSTISSGTVIAHQYNSSGGKYCTNLGYWIYKIRIWATTNITQYLPSAGINTYSNFPVFHSILSFVTNITTLTTTGNMFANYKLLQNVEIANLSLCTVMSTMFSGCSSLQRYNTTFSLYSTTTINNMFSSCSSIYSLKMPPLPATLGNNGVGSLFTNTPIKKQLYTEFSTASGTATSVFSGTLIETLYISQLLSSSNISSFCSNMPRLIMVTIDLWSTDNANRSSMFSGCQLLKVITLPTNKVTATSNNNIDSIFSGCNNLTTINNINNLGNDSYDTSAANAFDQCFSLQGTLTINFRLSKFGCAGSNGTTQKMKLSGLRLTNANSGFGGTSPQINVSYCSMNAAALNTLFGDLPTLTGKTINITGCDGAATCDRTIATNKGWTVTG